MDPSLVVFIILAVISLILGIILLISHVMELRDRPGLFIFGLLCIVAAVVFFILVLVIPQGPHCGTPFNGWTCVSPNP